MDVLSHWKPDLDDRKFEKGHLRDPFWLLFLELVQLSHCVVHWRAERREAERMARRVKNGGWEQAARTAETHEFRSRFLAAERVWKIESTADSERENMLASIIIKKTRLKKNSFAHEHADFGTLAMESFSGEL